MSHYEYKVVPAPKRAKKVRGVRSTDELFALTLTDAINEVARQGWEYVRAEHMPAEGPGGWFSRGASAEQTLLVFRRGLEALGPRLATVRTDRDAGVLAEKTVLGLSAERPAGTASGSNAAEERAAVERVQAHLRQRESQGRPEPRLGTPAAGESGPTPLRPGPRLGPAEP